MSLLDILIAVLIVGVAFWFSTLLGFVALILVLIFFFAR